VDTPESRLRHLFNGRVVDFFEFYDTAALVAAKNEGERNAENEVRILVRY
jgi:hypothetical protein